MPYILIEGDNYTNLEELGFFIHRLTDSLIKHDTFACLVTVVSQRHAGIL